MLDTYLASVPISLSRMAAVSPSSAVQFPLPYLPAPPPPPPPTSISYGATFQSKISPSILLIILILSVIFFVSGLLHLLVRCLLGRPASRETAGDDADIIHATAFQGQLQQLFHLHDAGVDQAFIDALPVFHYRSIVGAKRDPFDCAVCLCEFADDDRLRLLPKCSHAFHVACIDTWLLSHSTCPLCRRCLLADFPPYGGGRSPLVLVLDSGSDSSGRDFAASERLDTASSARLGLVIEEASALEGDHKQTHKDEVVVPVKLGKFRSQAVDSSSCSAKPSLDQRRCYSMGSYEYVMDETSVLQVAVKPSAKTHPALRKAGHRIAMSECDCHSKRESFRGLNAPKILPDAAAAAGGPDGGRTKQPAMQKKESFSVSKIWMRGGRKDRASASQQRVSSFRLPLQRGRGDVSPVTESEYNVSVWDKSEKSVSGSAVDWDLEAAAAGASWNGLHSRADEAPSFARRTLLWIRGHL